MNRSSRRKSNSGHIAFKPSLFGEKGLRMPSVNRKIRLLEERINLNRKVTGLFDAGLQGFSEKDKGTNYSIAVKLSKMLQKGKKYGPGKLLCLLEELATRNKIILPEEPRPESAVKPKRFPDISFGKNQNGR